MTGFRIENLSGDYADLILKQGDTIQIVLDLNVNTTDYDAKLCIKNKVGGTEISTFTVANSRVVIGGSNGLITFNMTAADSAELPAPFEGVFQIVITNTLNQVITYLQGKLFINPAVC